MGVGFYLTIAAAAIIFALAEHDKRNAWAWALGCFTFSLLLSQWLKVGVPAVFIGFFVTFVAMTLSNNKSPDQRNQ